MKTLCKGAFCKHHPYRLHAKRQPAFSRLGISKRFRCFPKASHRGCCRNRSTKAHCFRPNAIFFVVKGIKLRVDSRKNLVAEQEGGLSVTKDRSATALTQPLWGERKEEDKSPSHLFADYKTRRLFSQTSGIREVTSSGSVSALTASMSLAKT